MQDAYKALKVLGVNLHNGTWYMRTKNFVQGYWLLMLEGAGYYFILRHPTLPLPLKVLMHTEWFASMRLFHVAYNNLVQRKLKPQYWLEEPALTQDLP